MYYEDFEKLERVEQIYYFIILNALVFKNKLTKVETTNTGVKCTFVANNGNDHTANFYFNTDFFKRELVNLIKDDELLNDDVRFVV